MEKLGERLERKIEELRAGMSRVEERIGRLGERMDSLMRRMIWLLATIWGTIAALGLAALKLLAGG